MEEGAGKRSFCSDAAGRFCGAGCGLREHHLPWRGLLLPGSGQLTVISTGTNCCLPRVCKGEVTRELVLAAATCQSLFPCLGR